MRTLRSDKAFHGRRRCERLGLREAGHGRIQGGAVLEIQSVSMVYPGGVEALRGISLDLPRGIYGLLGANGAGKSTLMRTLATLQLPTAGSVRLGNIDLLAEPMRVRKVIGYLPQDAGVQPRVSAREMLSHLAGLRGIGPARVRRQRVDQWLDRVNLRDVADRRLDTYSGGMRQRFGIATVFLGDPELVIVDEPTAGLDPTERRRFQCLLAEAAEDCVLLLSSHLVEDLAGLCSGLALLHEGRVVVQGDPAGLVASLDGYIWRRRIPLADRSAWEARARLLSWRPARGELEVRAHGENLHELGFETTRPDLEDLYSLHTSSQGPAVAQECVTGVDGAA